MLDEKVIFGKYLSLYQNKGLGNFSHISHNLMETARIANFRKNQQAVVDKALGTLEKYLLLIDEFPDFKEKELNQIDCAYVDNVYSYVNSKYEKLKGKSSK